MATGALFVFCFLCPPGGSSLFNYTSTIWVARISMEGSLSPLSPGNSSAKPARRKAQRGARQRAPCRRSRLKPGGGGAPVP